MIGDETYERVWKIVRVAIGPEATLQDTYRFRTEVLPSHVDALFRIIEEQKGAITSLNAKRKADLKYIAHTSAQVDELTEANMRLDQRNLELDQRNVDLDRSQVTTAPLVEDNRRMREALFKAGVLLDEALNPHLVAHERGGR